MRQGRGVLERHAVRDRRERLLRRARRTRRRRRLPGREQVAEDLVARLEPGDVRPDRLDDAGDVDADARGSSARASPVNSRTKPGCGFRPSRSARLTEAARTRTRTWSPRALVARRPGSRRPRAGRIGRGTAALHPVATWRGPGGRNQSATSCRDRRHGNHSRIRVSSMRIRRLQGTVICRSTLVVVADRTDRPGWGGRRRLHRCRDGRRCALIAVLAEAGAADDGEADDHPRRGVDIQEGFAASQKVWSEADGVTPCSCAPCGRRSSSRSTRSRQCRADARSTRGVIRPIALVQACQRLLEVARHVVVEAWEGEGGLARSALEKRIARACQRIRVRVRDQEIQADVTLPGPDRSEVS